MSEHFFEAEYIRKGQNGFIPSRLFLKAIKQLDPSYTLEEKAEFVLTPGLRKAIFDENRFDKTFVGLVKRYKKAANQSEVGLAEAAIKQYMQDEDIYNDNCPDEAHFKKFCKGLDVDCLEKNYLLEVEQGSITRKINMEDVFILGN